MHLKRHFLQLETVANTAIGSLCGMERLQSWTLHNIQALLPLWCPTSHRLCQSDGLTGDFPLELSRGEKRWSAWASPEAISFHRRRRAGARCSFEYLLLTQYSLCSSLKTFPQQQPGQLSRFWQEIMILKVGWGVSWRLSLQLIPPNIPRILETLTSWIKPTSALTP